MERRKSCFNSKFLEYEYCTKRIRKLYGRAIRAVDKFNDEGIDFSERDLFKKLVIEGDNRKKKDQMTIREYLDKYIERLEANEQFYSKDNYKSLRNRLFGSSRLKPFFKEDFLFSQLNVGHLRDYISHLRSDGMGSGIQNYLKNFRALYNDAEEEEIFEMKKNPFKLIDFGKLSSEFNPRGLSISDLKKMLAFKIEEHDDLRESYFVFLFAYYCAGMRFTDCCKMTYKENVMGDKIVYRASKTQKMMPPIDIDDNLKYIMEQIDMGTGYITPFLNEFHKESKQKYYRIKKCNKKYNEDLKRLGALLGIEIKITSHVARHSVASVLSEIGATIREIQGVYNHQRSDTTRHYLARLGHSQVSKVHQKLKV